MKTRDLSVIAVRATAIWLLFTGITMLEQIPVLFFNPFSGGDAFTRYYAAVSTINLVLYMSLGVGLLWKTDAAASFLTRGLDSGEGMGIGIPDLALVSFSVVGLVVFVSGLGTAVQEIATYYFKPGVDFGGQVVKTAFNPGKLASGLTKVFVGVVLVFSPSGLLRAIRWTRG